MATMRAVDIHNGKGPAESLFINDTIQRPVPRPTECLVRVKAFGINRADTGQRLGLYPPPPGVTKILGLEFAGTVEEVGSDNGGEKYERGDEVFGLTYGGSYAEYVAVSKKMLVRKPKQLSWEECAAIPEVWMTALQALHLVGEWSPKVKAVTWHAGASSVSIAGIQLCQALSPKPKIFATTRSDSKCEFLVKSIGVDAAINTTKSYGESNGSWANEICRMNDGQGVDLIIDYTAASYFSSNLDLLALDGKVVILGALGGTTLPEKTDISAILRKRATVVGSTLRSRDPDYQGKLRDLFCEEVLPKLISGQFKMTIERVLSWGGIAQAHSLLEQNKTQGKVVCLVD